MEIDTTGCVNNTILTATGRYFDYDDPLPAQIAISDIAKALSNTCRFGGHCDFYSVAEHCCHCYDLAKADKPGDVAFLKLALLHDAAEAYIGDMPKPLKNIMPQFREMEARIEAVIATVFDLDESRWPDVKQLDLYMLKAEKAALFPNDDCEWTGLSELPEIAVDIRLWSPTVALSEFASRFMEIS